MVRHGWVAEHYLNGDIDSDAEVALLMDPVTSVVLTVPLLNIRWPLRGLEENGTLSPQEGEEVLHIAQRTHYRARTPEILLEAFQRNLKYSCWQLLERALKPEEIPSWDRKHLGQLPAVLIGNAEQIAGQVLARRERFGLNYFTVQEAALEAFASVIPLLT